MAFTAKKTDNSIAAVVNDFESTIVGGLELLGYGYVNYSEEIANNFIRVAENFANITPPPSPLRGQLWWDTSMAGQPALWVCFNPSGAASPVTARWSQIFQVGKGVSLDDLTDVDTGGVSSGDTIQYNGTEWVTTPAGPTTLSGLSDVDTTGVTTGDFLKFDGDDWVPSEIVSSLSTLSDVNTAGAVDGSVLKFNGTNWVVGTDLQSSGGGGGGGGPWAPVSHTHVISNVTGLQTALDSKLSLASLLAVDGQGSGIDSDLLDGHHGSFYLDLSNHIGTLPDSVITPGFSSSTNGWIKIGSLYMMWGLSTVPISPSRLDVSVTFPITFPTAVLHMYLTDRSNFNGGDNEDEDKWIAAFNRTGATIGVWGDRAQTNYLSWLAIGY